MKITAIESKFANTISASYDYAIVKGSKLSKKDRESLKEGIKEFIKFNFATSEKQENLDLLRMKYTDFTAKFAKWDADKFTVDASSLDLHSIIQETLFEIAKIQKENGCEKIPVFKTNKEDVEILCCVPTIYYSQYYSKNETAIESAETRKANKANKAKKESESVENAESVESVDSNILTIDANSPSQASALVIQLIAKYADNPEFDLSAIQHAIDSTLELASKVEEKKSSKKSA